MIENQFPPLSVIVRNREGILFQGNIVSLSGTNEKGIFDILPLHSNFISLIDQTITLKTVGGEIKQIDVPSGVLRVIENSIEVFVGFAA